jgi:hypothetical protein
MTSTWFSILRYSAYLIQVIPVAHDFNLVQYLTIFSVPYSGYSSSAWLQPESGTLNIVRYWTKLKSCSTGITWIRYAEYRKILDQVEVMRYWNNLNQVTSTWSSILRYSAYLIQVIPVAHDFNLVQYLTIFSVPDSGYSSSAWLHLGPVSYITWIRYAEYRKILDHVEVMRYWNNLNQVRWIS